MNPTNSPIAGELINKYGKYPNNLYGILESLYGNNTSEYTAAIAFRDIEALLKSTLNDCLPEKKIDLMVSGMYRAGYEFAIDQTKANLAKALGEING